MLKRMLSSFFLVFVLGACGSSGGGSEDSGIPKSIGDELEKWNVAVNELRGSHDAELPLDIMSHAGWGSVQSACSASGYDLTPFAGTDVSLRSYATEEVCSGISMLVYALAQGETVICLFKAYENPPAGGGIFSIQYVCPQ